MKRVFRNGTIAWYYFNGLFYAFMRFEKSPTSLYVDCEISAYDNPSQTTLTSSSTVFKRTDTFIRVLPTLP